MFKNDRMMMILTGLVLAIFAGSMVQYGDRIVAIMAGEEVASPQDDSYSVRAGASQILDVLSNDTVKGPIVVLTRPSCGTIAMSSDNRLSFTSDAACSGEVEFAYCVDSEGKCAPNAVKINVISVSFAQGDSTTTGKTTPAATTERNQAESQDPVLAMASNQPRSPQTNAPDIASFAVEMAPPALAVPDMTELVSPGMAVASIRRATSGLNSASATDQNITAQNSASVGQTASSGPAVFSAPTIGESSNITLGGSERAVASIVSTPSGLQAAGTEDNNLVQLARGPVALDTLQIAQVLPARDTSPLAASPERNGDAPVFVASAQTNEPSPEANFNASQTNGGPIAMIALNLSPTRGNAAGESLNIVLSEPGVQSFIAPAETPEALAPTSARPSTVSVLEHAPSIAEQILAPAALSFSSNLAAGVSSFSDRHVGFEPSIFPSPNAAFTPFNAIGTRVAASQPTQIAAPAKLALRDFISRFISVSQGTTWPKRTVAIASLASPEALAFSRPRLDMHPAEKPQILQASLALVPEFEVTTAPVQNSNCEIALSASQARGANIALDISAACKPNQMVTIEHAGLAFSVRTDSQGVASVVVPAMQADAEVSVRFTDQSTSSARISVRDIDSVIRAGVSWQANMNLDLTAIEFGAAIGSDGYISPETPRDYRTSRVKGGGYLMLLGDPSLERGALAEVYTLPTQRNQQRGTIAMSVVISDVAPVCGQTINAKTVRTRDGRSAGIRNVRFSVPSCGTVLSGPIALPGAIDDIRLAGR